MNCFTRHVGKLLIKQQLSTCRSKLRYFSQSFTNNNQFKSVYSLENLYPKSNVRLYTPSFTPLEPNAKFSGFIPMNELQVTYSHSSGPGGMNVNATNTKVDLRFHVQSASWLSDELKEKLLIQEKNRINKEGYLIIKSELTRVQHLNLADALQRLRTMIRKCTVEKLTISPETEEQIRKRQIKAARERIFQKRKRSDIKQGRNVSNIDL